MSMRGHAVTIKNVAKKARVSIATVSRVLNAKGKYSRETGARVLNAAKELGYSANLLARGLKTGHSRTVGVALGSYHLMNHPSLLLSAAEVLKRQGLDIQVFLNLGLKDCAHLLAEGKVDGLLLTEAKNDDLALKALIDTGKQFVCLGGDVEREDVNLVEIDYFQGGYIATQHLLSLGHREILIAAADDSLPFTQEIVRGYLVALDERGVQYREELIIRTGERGTLFGERAGYEAIGTAGRELRFSAVVATDDRIACGAIKAMLDGGRRVPGDLSVVGFGNFSASGFFPVPLTTIEVPVSQMGELGAEILANGIQRMDTVVKRIKLKVNLVHRATTAKKLT